MKLSSSIDTKSNICCEPLTTPSPLGLKTEPLTTPVPLPLKLRVFELSDKPVPGLGVVEGKVIVFVFTEVTCPSLEVVIVSIGQGCMSVNQLMCC